MTKIFHLLIGLILVTGLVPAKASAETQQNSPQIQTWGAMREVLHDGKTEERITLAAQLSEHTIAVGAVAGLAGEITVLNGVVHVATFDKGKLNSSPSQSGVSATLLVMAEVPVWRQQILPELSDFSSVENAVRTAAQEAGIDVSQPFPFIIEGLATDFSLHVIAGACPIANPDGTPPGRFKDQDRSISLVGFFAENQAGRLTHHNRSSHVHIVVAGDSISGHLDEVSFTAGALLRLPD